MPPRRSRRAKEASSEAELSQDETKSTPKQTPRSTRKSTRSSSRPRQDHNNDHGDQQEQTTQDQYHEPSDHVEQVDASKPVDIHDDHEADTTMAAKTKGKRALKQSEDDAPTLKKTRTVENKAAAVVSVHADFDDIASVARSTWLQDMADVNVVLVEKVYRHLEQSDFQAAMVSELEELQFLEKCLWPLFDGDNSSFQHLLLLIVIMNEKFRQRLDPFGRDDKFASFLYSAAKASIRTDLSARILREFVSFFTRLLTSLENASVRAVCLPWIGLGAWSNMIPKRRENLLSSHPSIQKMWSSAEKKLKKASEEGKEKIIFDRTWFSQLLQRFSSALRTHSPEDAHAFLLCEAFVNLLINIVSQLPTRRFLNALIDDHNTLVELTQSLFIEYDSVKSLVAMLTSYIYFPVDDLNGTPMSMDEMDKLHADSISALQLFAFQHENLKQKLEDFWSSHALKVGGRAKIHYYFRNLSMDDLQFLCNELGLRSSSPDGEAYSHMFIVEVLTNSYAPRESPLDKVNALSLYPDEVNLWDRSLLGMEWWNGDGCLALPRLNLQFLSIHDYLLRNYNLYRYESAYQIRQDLEDAILRMSPRLVIDSTVKNQTEFGGWSRMAVSVESVKLAHIAAPRIGEVAPASVRAEISYSVARFSDVIRDEWDLLRPHDVLFLVTIKAPPHYGSGKWEPLENGLDADGNTFADFFGIVNVRGCEVIDFVDDEGRLTRDTEGKPRLEGEKPILIGNRRKLRVLLDPNQFHADLKSGKFTKAQAKENVRSEYFDSFNVLVRRKPKENNFKAVLETIRDLMQTTTDSVIPDWLANIFVGFGDPSGAHYTKMISYLEEKLSVVLRDAGSATGLSDEKRQQLRTIDFGDTFLSLEHLKESFPSADLTFAPPSEDEMALMKARRRILASHGEAVETGVKELEPPFILTFDEKNASKIVAKAHVPDYFGPFVETKQLLNKVRFTPTQVEAIRSGSSPGLTMIVGPPGTGKTDVAVQILSNIYHNHPEQHTLIVTHSNQALNQLFEKLTALNIEQRHLLRLGHGEEELDARYRQGNANFGKYGRVSWFLEHRLKLLADVERLATVLDVPGGKNHAGTCETSVYFYLNYVLAKWQPFIQKWEALCDEGNEDAEQTKAEFPFTKYFELAPLLERNNAPLFPPYCSVKTVLEVARGCWRYLQKMFEELEEIRPFELLRSGYDRANYLLTKQARIVAMTCTHAALKRRELISLGFKYENIIMEEAAQVLEVETFIPMLLQSGEKTNAASPLQRVVLIGDHFQLPPIVKNMAFQKFANMDQSLFTRFVRLGVPTITLDAQGRARPSIRELYSWRYERLVDLPIISQPEYKQANAGFAHDYQLIHVGEYMGRNESEPSPHYYQNLGEAEYVVAVYQYMRLLGYPSEKITILTTYNGQKALIRDVLNQRCTWNPLFGRPHKITTVDKFQGQQNDYILLSLVRTRTVGHLRDIRRLVVAMSRARLGLYVFCRQPLFATCPELEPCMKQFLKRPTKLQLVENERYGRCARLVDQEPKGGVLTVDDVVQLGSLVYAQTKERLK